MTTKSIEVSGTQPLVSVQEDGSNVNVVNQPVEILVSASVATGNAQIRNALDAVDPIYYNKQNGVFGFRDRSEVVRGLKMIEPATLPEYVGDISGDVVLDAENYDIFVLNIAGDITSIEFTNMAVGQTVTIIGTQSATGQGNIDDTSGNWSNWFWVNDNSDLPQNVGDVFMIKVLWTGNTYYASLMEFNTLLPETQVGIPVSDTPPDNPDSGWLWYRYNDPDEPNALMIYVDGGWVVAGGGGGASVIVSEDQPPNPSEGDLWYDTTFDPPQLKIYNGVVFEIVNPAEQGYTGSRGYTGSIGGHGYTGSQGFGGSVGFTGSAGQDGDDGFTGSRGFTGSKGADSTVQGPVGFTGSRGYNGSRGSRGWTGSRGFTGSHGFTGSAGSDSTVPGPVGSTGFNGSKGDQGDTGFTGSRGFTGSAGQDSTTPGPVGSTGFTGSKGFTGSAGFTGSRGIQGSVGYQGSKGEDGQGVIQAEPNQDDLLYARIYRSGSADGEWEPNIIQSEPPQDDQQYARTFKIGAPNGQWELVEATGGGGEWDGILYDKPALIHQPNNISSPSQNNSGITIGKNGFSDDLPFDPLPVLNVNNMVIGTDSKILGNQGDPGTDDIILIGNQLTISPGTVPNQSMILGNTSTRNVYFGVAALFNKDQVLRYGTAYDVARIAPSPFSSTTDSILLDSDHNLILSAGYTGNPDSDANDKNLQFNASRVKHRLAYNKQNNQTAGTSISEIFPDWINFLSAGNTSHMPGSENQELGNYATTWKNQRKINYFSPERLRIRKFTECVNRQKINAVDGAYGYHAESGPTLTVQIDYGTIHHSVMIADITEVIIDDVKNVESPFGLTREASAPEPGTSITVILYHKDALRTITWPDNFKFLGGENTLSTAVSTLPDQNINGVTVSGIQAIDMLHAFYDGISWWCSITRGYE